MFVQSDRIYTIDEIQDFILDTNELITAVEKKGKIIANIPAAFDIETSSFYVGGQKQAIMYIWQFSIGGIVIIGREWKEFHYLLNQLSGFHNLGDERHMIIFIHNLAYEFAWLARRLKFSDMFFKDVRKPLYLITEDGFEFRCSYALSNLSLADCGKSLTKYKVEKKVGQLDYAKIRTPKTPLTKEELEYCVNDVKVVCAYVQELIEQEGDITKLPYTKTAFARNFCRNRTLYEGSGKRRKYKKKYRDMIKNLTLTPETYDFARGVFQGGYTHANARNADKVMENVHSIDFTSSYPYVMVSQTFPMSTPEKVENCGYKQLKELNKKYHSMFEIAFERFELNDDAPDCYVSSSKCGVLKGKYDERGKLIEPVIINNGRVEYAEFITMKITDVDLKIIKKYYKWDIVKVRNVYKMVKDFLPRSFILAILSLYHDKTALKGVKEQENFYQVAKGLLNSLYGMSVTSALNDEIKCDFHLNDYEFIKTPCDAEKEIEKYNNSKSRFLYYLWGLWVTAWARYNLLMCIYQFGGDYIYADTDSIKFINYDAHKDFITAYNESVINRLRFISSKFDIEFDQFAPKTLEGEEKPLGVWDWETNPKKGAYTKFKTLGAKRYLYEQKGELHLTVSGINKTKGAEWFASQKDPFAAFTNFTVVPAADTGRQVLTYLDSAYSGVVTDYMGVTYEYHELSGVHMENTTYEFNISAIYINLIKGKQELTMLKN